MENAAPVGELTSAHWLEHLSVNLQRLPSDAQRTAYSLLYSPWECSREDVLKHVPTPLSESIIFVQASVLRHVFNRRPRLGYGVAVRSVGISASVRTPDGLYEALESNTLIAVEAYIGVIKEDLAKLGMRWDEMSGAARASLLAMYVKCESAVYLMAGMIEPAKDGLRDIHYIVPARLDAARKRRWFSLYWTQQSNYSDFHHAAMVWQALSRTSRQARKNELFQAWVDSILDKYLCLHKNYIPKLLRTKNGDAISQLRKRAELLCFIWLQFPDAQLSPANFSRVVVEGQPILSISRDKLEQAGFEQAEVNELLKESTAQPMGDQFIANADAPGYIDLHNQNLKFAVQLYARVHFDRIGPSVGNWFERDYILEFLRSRLESLRFATWPGIKDAEKGYDADIIILDHATRIFYFCQIKHRARVLQPYLRDELNEYNRNEAINHGIDQLNNLRKVIDSDQTRSLLVSKFGKKLVGAGALSVRSRFILIHTVENFDMCTRRGVSMYEWNTFRNLVQGRMFVSQREVDGTLHYGTENLDFSNLEAVQSHLINVSDKLHTDVGPDRATSKPTDMYELLQHSELSVQYRSAFWLKNVPFGSLKARMLRTPLL